MAKGYWIARIDIHNMDGYKEYIAQNGAVFAKYGAKFLVRAGPHQVKEGSSRSRNVVLEFKDYDTSPATIHRNTPGWLRSAARIRRAISSSSKAMTARSPAKAGPARLPEQPAPAIGLEEVKPWPTCV